MLIAVELHTVLHVLSNVLPGALSPPPAALFDCYLGLGLGVCSAGDTCNRGIIYPSHIPVRKLNVCTAWNQMTDGSVDKSDSPHTDERTSSTQLTSDLRLVGCAHLCGHTHTIE